MMNILFISAGILLCLVFSNFFSASEMAYSSCNRLRLENSAQEGSRHAAIALKIIQRFDDALSAILIGNNLVNIASSSLASVLVILVTGKDSLTWVATILLTLLVIIFGETIPKIAAKQNANRLAERNAPVIRALMIVLKPLIMLVVGLVRLLTFWIKEEEVGEDEAVDELSSLIETAEDEEVMDEDRSGLVQATIDFSEIDAFDVMTSRVDVEAIDVDDDWDDILTQVENSSYSRIPVYEGSIDNVIGDLYMNRLLQELTEGERAIRTQRSEPCYV